MQNKISISEIGSWTNELSLISCRYLDYIKSLGPTQGVQSIRLIVGQEDFEIKIVVFCTTFNYTQLSLREFVSLFDHMFFKDALELCPGYLLEGFQAKAKRVVNRIGFISPLLP